MNKLKIDRLRELLETLRQDLWEAKQGGKDTSPMFIDDLKQEIRECEHAIFMEGG